MTNCPAAQPPSRASHPFAWIIGARAGERRNRPRGFPQHPHRRVPPVPPTAS